MPTKAPGIFRFETFRDGRLIHGVANRRGGVSSPPFDSLNLSVKTGDDGEWVVANRRLFEQSMGVSAKQVVFGRLQHGADVAVFRRGGLLPNLSEPGEREWPMFVADAAITDIPGLLLVMTFADCVPILLWDPERDACALIHAGWRGTALRIASATVRAMVEAFRTRPGNLRAGIGPSIGPCCYTVGNEVVARIREGYIQEARELLSDGKLDLWTANSLDLISAGVSPQSTEVARICTACNTDAYFSHRGEHGRTGRFGACIGLNAPS